MLHLNRIIPLLFQHKRFLLLFPVSITIITAILLAILPSEYKSVATIVPVNLQLSDKARLFNSNIKDLYPFFGNGDDMERIESAKDWNSIYQAMVIELNLTNYFRIFESNPEKRLHKAVRLLQKKLFTYPNEKGQLNIIAWAKEPETAKKWVEIFRSKINARIYSSIDNQYQKTIHQLQISLDSLQQEYMLLSAVKDSTPAAKILRETKLQSIQQLIGNNFSVTREWKQTRLTLPDVMIVLDDPIADSTAIRPDKKVVLPGAFLAALLFGMAWIIIYHRKNLQ